MGAVGGVPRRNEVACSRTRNSYAKLWRATRIVSIDSPLSLPEGVTDPDVVGDSPIYRKCELALKRMGISVFWCLLPSMKSLTTRGMQLAAEMRKRGLTVIESYPGAAQDLLGIPRKGASLEELKQGMGRIGIKGDT